MTTRPAPAAHRNHSINPAAPGERNPADIGAASVLYVAEAAARLLAGESYTVSGLTRTESKELAAHFLDYVGGYVKRRFVGGGAMWQVSTRPYGEWREL